MSKIEVETQISLARKAVWDYYTLSENIQNWDFANEGNHVSTTFSNKSVSSSGDDAFYHKGYYKEIDTPKKLSLELEDGSKLSIHFEENGSSTIVKLKVDAADTPSIDMQTQNWQDYLNNFKDYVNSKTE